MHAKVWAKNLGILMLCGFAWKYGFGFCIIVINYRTKNNVLDLQVVMEFDWN
jgi:hypothetical protein